MIGFTQESITVDEFENAELIVKVLSGALAPGEWVELEFTTSDMPSSNTSAVCKYN